MGGAGLVLGVAFVAAAIFVAFLLVPFLRRAAKDRMRAHDAVNNPEVETLGYRVPEGQDPAAVMAALRGEGFEPVGDRDDDQSVLVPCRSDRDRDRVRSAIAAAGMNLEDEGGHGPDRVRFTDE